MAVYDGAVSTHLFVYNTVMRCVRACCCVEMLRLGIVVEQMVTVIRKIQRKTSYHDDSDDDKRICCGIVMTMLMNVSQ